MTFKVTITYEITDFYDGAIAEDAERLLEEAVRFATPVGHIGQDENLPSIYAKSCDVKVEAA